MTASLVFPVFSFGLIHLCSSLLEHKLVKMLSTIGLGIVTGLITTWISGIAAWKTFLFVVLTCIFIFLFVSAGCPVFSSLCTCAPVGLFFLLLSGFLEDSQNRQVLQTPPEEQWSKKTVFRQSSLLCLFIFHLSCQVLRERWIHVLLIDSWSSSNDCIFFYDPLNITAKWKDAGKPIEIEAVVGFVAIVFLVPVLATSVLISWSDCGMKHGWSIFPRNEGSKSWNYVLLLAITIVDLHDIASSLPNISRRPAVGNRPLKSSSTEKRSWYWWVSRFSFFRFLFMYRIMSNF